MATYNGNNIFLSLDGLDVSAKFTDELAFNHANALQETTAGAGVEGVQRGKGLNDRSLTVVLIYDDADLAAYIDKLEPGEEFAVIYGPRTSVAGNPKLQGNFRIASTSHAVNIARNLVKFNIQFQQSDEPTSDIHAGDTF